MGLGTVSEVSTSLTTSRSQTANPEDTEDGRAKPAGPDADPYDLADLQEDGPSVEDPTTSHMLPTQRVLFDQLLSVGTERPHAPEGLVETLRARVEEGVAETVARWGRLWFSKSMLTEGTRCEGLVLAGAASASGSVLHPATMVGILAHRAIQMSQTHPGGVPAELVSEALRAARANEERFARTWETMGDADRSDVQMAAVSRLIAFLDSWPPLQSRWYWRFEESMQCRIGDLTLAARVDLVLGRPRADGRQTMLLCDLKSGALADHHLLEASFYALVATLRWGIPPWRSTVFSLSSGEWTDPEVTEGRLLECADQVVEAVRSRVEVLSELRSPRLTGGPWCRFCPRRDSCDMAEGQELAPSEH